MLSALSEGWQHRLFQSPSEVVPELIAELQRREADQSNLLRRPRHVDEIRENNAFAHLMRAWTNAEFRLRLRAVEGCRSIACCAAVLCCLSRSETVEH